MIGQFLSHFRVVEKLGVGGMGEVYRARDTKLARDVALKVLPEVFAANSERMARFQREAQVLASLNHPNIAAIYGLEESGSTRALVMELVEGKTLADQLKNGPIRSDETLPIARQIADALEYAHERGIVHRDLKPANIKITPEGTIKVLDFGLAKALDPGAASSPTGTQAMQDSPTLTAATQAGVILGTAAYMSPEQAKGKPVDRRADIWAFGCVLYEMLVGKRIFDGETVTDVLAALITKEPDWDALPAETPPRIRELIRRCLTKDAKKRLRDIGEARITIEETISGAEASLPRQAKDGGTKPPLQSPLHRVLPWALGVGCVVLAAALLVAHFTMPATAMLPTRSQISPPEKVFFALDEHFGGPVLSPDGTKLVLPAQDESGKESLWLRPIDSLSATRLEGTKEGSYPFWSPDSRRIGFFQNEILMKLDVTGGPAVKVCDAPNPRGGTWNQDDVIIFASLKLSRVPAGGGTPTPITSRKPSGPAFSNRWPTFLPDGRHFLYLSGNLTAPGTPQLGIYMGNLDSDEVTFVVQADSDALYAPSGYLLFLRGDMLMAQPFDASNLKIKGESHPVVEQVASPMALRLGLFTASQTGLLVYQTGEAAGIREFVWYDAAGKQLGTIGEPRSKGEGDFILSPDGNRLAYVIASSDAKNTDVWVADLKRNIRTRVTLGTSLSAAPVWSPDGDRIVYSYSSPQTGIRDLYVKNSSGAGKEETILGSAVNKFPLDWSRDGRYILFDAVDPKAKSIYVFDIWVLPLFGDRKPFPYMQTRFDETDGAFSPDAHWVAYESNESGTYEIYLSSFPAAGNKWQVTQGGGSQPRWKGDSSGIYYRTPDERLMEVSVKADGSTLEIGKPHELFQTEMADATPGDRAYSVAPDGKRFLVVKPVHEASPPLTLVTNWTAGLKE
jgi:eukaryotic-like serine/threonine-protein kinase